MFRFCDRDLVVAAALGTSIGSRSGGGHADRSAAGVSGYSSGLSISSACRFTIGYVRPGRT